MQGSKLYVGNLNYAVTEEELETLFSAHGSVKSVKVIEGRGFGFVEMSAPEEAEAAQEALNEVQFQGRSLRIDEARPQRKKEYGGGRSRDGSRGGGHRNSRGGYGSSRGGGRGSRGGGGYRRDEY
jgi:RNA recognition motif-containing protein